MDAYSKKNKILLGIFVTGVIGFLILLYNRPPLTDEHAFDNISFPPTPQDLYYLSQVTHSPNEGSYSLH